MLAFWCTVLISFALTSAQQNDLEVKTTGGWVKGTFAGSTDGENKPIYSWRRIPFAEPPVGKLRFQPPVPKAAWSGILDVSDMGPSCIQGSDEVTGSEDCLFLKIYTTDAPSLKKNRSVVVWIHGGFFWSGRSDFDGIGIDHLLDKDVIVVGIQYRLGALGFMSTGDKSLPGNNGLRDQILALKWIHANIRNFGGDPDKITIAGQSAGAASVGYLLQIPQAKGLFSKAILQSGSPLCMWSKAQETLNLVTDIGFQLNLTYTNTSDLVEQLRYADIAELQPASVSARNAVLFGQNILDGLVFVPTIEPEYDGALITQGSYEILSSGNYSQVPILAGFTTNEMSLSDLPAIIKFLLVTYDMNSTLLAPISLHATEKNFESAGRQIKTYYFGQKNITDSPNELSRFVTDDMFWRSITKSVELYSAHSDVYFYQFSYKGHLKNDEPNRKGPTHTEDLYYIFDFPTNGNETDEDFVVKDRMVKMWTNFIKRGNPTPRTDGVLENVIWPSNRGQKQLKMLDINANLTIIDPANQVYQKFWQSLFSKYGRPPFITY